MSNRKVPENLLTGFVLIDRQHEDIYRRFDELEARCQAGCTRDQVVEALRFLEEQTTIHFDFEETAMKAFDYPNVIEHMAAHLVMREMVKRLSAEIRKSGPTPDLLAQVRSLLYDALFRHIAEHDLKMAPFLKEKNPDGWTL
jgi:hemerythrin-like metal-binding protein